MNWFRFYHAALDDPKVQLLDDALFKAWVNLLCLASEGKERGFLPPVEAIAFRLRTNSEAAQEVVNALIEHRLLDAHDGRLMMHNWPTRQPASDDVNARVTKHRQSKKQDETLQETLLKRESNGLDKTRQDKTRQEKNSLAGPDAAPVSEYRAVLGEDYWSALTAFKKIDAQLSNGWLDKALKRAPPGLSADELWGALENALNRIGEDFERNQTQQFIKSKYGWANTIVDEEFTDLKGITT